MLPNIKRYESEVEIPNTIGDIDKLGDILKNNTPNTKYFEEEQQTVIPQQSPTVIPNKTNRKPRRLYGKYKVLITLRLTTEEAERILSISQQTNVNPSAVIRLAINKYLSEQDHNDKGGDTDGSTGD